jgi:hypothetical protein
MIDDAQKNILGLKEILNQLIESGAAIDKIMELQQKIGYLESLMEKRRNEEPDYPER